MHARQIGPLNLGAKLYVRKKSQIIFVGAGYRVFLAATDSNQRPVNGPSRSLAAAASHTGLGSERGICSSWLAWRRGANRKDLRFAQIPHNVPTPLVISRRSRRMLPDQNRSSIRSNTPRFVPRSLPRKRRRSVPSSRPANSPAKHRHRRQ
jgi:hypothetical protein